MLHADAFTRKLPRAIELKERLILDALVMASDLASFSYKKLRENIVRLDEKMPVEQIGSLLVEVAHFAWSLVDQAHNFGLAFRIVRADGRLGTEARARFSTATHMRNGMDHLSSNAGNHSKRKKPGPPIYGALSYYTVVSNEEVVFNTLNLGSVQHDSFISPIMDMKDELSGPLANLSLSAFGKQLRLDQLASDIEAEIVTFDKWYCKEVTTKIYEDAIKLDMNFDDLLKDQVPQIPWMKMHIRSGSQIA